MADSTKPAKTEVQLGDIGYESLLFDFYGGLLPEQQREIMSAYHEDDLSLAEIAEEKGMSRQGVHHALKKAEAKIAEYEENLGLVEKHIRNIKLLSEAEALMREMEAAPGNERYKEQISVLMKKIREVAE